MNSLLTEIVPPGWLSNWQKGTLVDSPRPPRLITLAQKTAIKRPDQVGAITTHGFCVLFVLIVGSGFLSLSSVDSKQISRQMTSPAIEMEVDANTEPKSTVNFNIPTVEKIEQSNKKTGLLAFLSNLLTTNSRQENSRSVNHS